MGKGKGKTKIVLLLGLPLTCKGRGTTPGGVFPLPFTVFRLTCFWTFEPPNVRTFERHSTDGEKSETRLSMASQMWEMSLAPTIRSRLVP